MPRKPRFNLPGYTQHVFQRGYNNQSCFLSDRDCRFYLKCLQIACTKYQCAIHAYVLMLDHVHLLVTPQEGCGVSRLMQALGRNYVRYFNTKYDRRGALWQGRYKSSLVQDDQYFLLCSLYIETNPVRAGIAIKPGDYVWSSYRSNALGERSEVVTPHISYLALARQRSRRFVSYRKLFEIEPNHTELNDVRHCLDHELVLGSELFRDEIQALTNNRPVRHGVSGRPRKDATVNQAGI